MIGDGLSESGGNCPGLVLLTVTPVRGLWRTLGPGLSLFFFHLPARNVAGSSRPKSRAASESEVQSTKIGRLYCSSCIQSLWPLCR